MPSASSTAVQHCEYRRALMRSVSSLERATAAAAGEDEAAVAGEENIGSDEKAAEEEEELLDDGSMFAAERLWLVRSVGNQKSPS
jgi:hypothetical protein